MDTRALGRTGLRVSLLGLGTGGANVFGQARGASPDEARALVRAALDLGDRLLRHRRRPIATARSGWPRRWPACRARDYRLATKVQPRAADGALLTPAEVEAAIERSLDRLRDRRPSTSTRSTPCASPTTTRSWRRHLPVLVRAREAGRIRAIGVTESFAGDDPRHETLAPGPRRRASPTCVMVGYNVLHQNAERDILPRAATAGVGVVVMAAVRRALAHARGARGARRRAQGGRPSSRPDACSPTATRSAGWSTTASRPSRPRATGTSRATRRCRPS